MKSTRALIAREYIWRIALSLLSIEILIFLLPTSGKIEGLASGYWEGVGRRLTSSGYWARALLCGIGFAASIAALSPAI